MKYTDGCKEPKERAVAPGHQAQKLRARRNRRGTRRSDEGGCVVGGETTALNITTQGLQSEASLSEWADQDHELEHLRDEDRLAYAQQNHIPHSLTMTYLLLDGEGSVEDPLEEDGSEYDSEWKANTNE